MRAAQQKGSFKHGGIGYEHMEVHDIVISQKRTSNQSSSPNPESDQTVWEACLFSFYHSVYYYLVHRKIHLAGGDLSFC